MNMRVFVYSKVTNKKIAQVNNVTDVQSLEGKNKIIFITSDNEQFTFNTKEIKATIYQN